MRTILLIDDDPAIIFGFQSDLEMEGFKVDSAHSSEDARLLIGKNAYQLVVTDLNLSGKNDLEGLELVKFARAHQPESTIIIVSGISDEDIKNQAIHNGALHYFEKPVEARSIIKVFSEIFH